MGSSTEYLRIKDLSPNINAPFNLKAIVLEKQAPDKVEGTGNVLVADETGCVNVVVSGAIVNGLQYGDILRLKNTTKLMASGNRLYVATNEVSRVGEFAMLFKESHNMSRFIWAQDPSTSQWSIASDSKARK